MNKTLEEQLRDARNEKLNHEEGSYAYNIWRREVKRITKLIEEK